MLAVRFRRTRFRGLTVCIDGTFRDAKVMHIDDPPSQTFGLRIVNITYHCYRINIGLYNKFVVKFIAFARLNDEITIRPG